MKSTKDISHKVGTISIGHQRKRIWAISKKRLWISRSQIGSPELEYPKHRLSKGENCAEDVVKYFAYGSNMSNSRLSERVPGAVALGCHILPHHDLRFHKSGKDGSGKCNVFYTGEDKDIVYGTLFEISRLEKTSLDKIEGLGYGYDEKNVIVFAADGSSLEAMTYAAIRIDEHLKPYSWYLNHVLVGAREIPLPDEYIERKISAIASIEDADKERDARERALHS